MADLQIRRDEVQHFPQVSDSSSGSNLPQLPARPRPPQQ